MNLFSSKQYYVIFINLYFNLPIQIDYTFSLKYLKKLMI